MPERGSSSSPDLLRDVQMTKNVVVLVILCAASTVQLLLRRPGTVGPRYFGAKPLGGILLMVAFTAARNVRDSDPRVLMWYMAALLVLCGVHRAASYYRIHRGVPLHRYYVGDSVLYNEGKTKFRRSTTRAFDIVLAPCLGVYAHLLGSTTLGLWMVIAGVASLLSTAMLELRDRERDHAMRDAMLEQVEWAERARRTAAASNAHAQSHATIRPRKFVKSRVISSKENKP